MNADPYKGKDLNMLIARIELRDATREQYEALHDAMTAYGYERTVKADNGLRYDLPDATYVHHTSNDAEAGHAAAVNAALGVVGPNRYGVFVGQYVRSVFTLPPWQPWAEWPRTDVAGLAGLLGLGARP